MTHPSIAVVMSISGVVVFSSLFVDKVSLLLVRLNFLDGFIVLSSITIWVSGSTGIVDAGVVVVINVIIGGEFSSLSVKIL